MESKKKPIKRVSYGDRRFLAVRTFSYYIPGPPTRKTGFREKEFDIMMAKILQLKVELLDIKSTNLNSEHSSGVLILSLLGVKDFSSLEALDSDMFNTLENPKEKNLDDLEIIYDEEDEDDE